MTDGNQAATAELPFRQIDEVVELFTAILNGEFIRWRRAASGLCPINHRQRARPLPWPIWRLRADEKAFRVNCLRCAWADGDHPIGAHRWSAVCWNRDRNLNPGGYACGIHEFHGAARRIEAQLGLPDTQEHRRSVVQILRR